MQVRSEREWQEISLEYSKRGGKDIIEFAADWATWMEELSDTELSWREVVEGAYVQVDEKRKIADGTLAEVLFVLSQVWEYGDVLINNLTPLEMTIFQSTVTAKINALEEQASKVDIVGRVQK